MEALYRKYRPATFANVVGQEHIERTLKNAIEQNKVSHAYLFCGPRGTGKTTMARILAKALLCVHGPTPEPDGTCEECQAIAQGTHPDVYELDAASRTGVENVREEIISRVNYAPVRGVWKIYIIDEVHMLSTAAFNALLKTLEEPPSHVVFILCTTDPQKVPATIHSRCQRFDFHRISAEAIVSRLGAICVEEGAQFEGEALDLIAYRAEGGMRNALTALEQLIAFGNGTVTLEGAQHLLGSLDDTDLSEIVVAIGKRDAAACFNWTARYIETGADLAQFVRDLSQHIRNLYLLSMAGLEVEIQVSEATRKTMVDQLKYFGQERLSRLLNVLGELTSELRTSSNPRLSFEIALTRMIHPESDVTVEALAERIEVLEAKVAQLEAGDAVGAGAAQLAAVQSSPAAKAPRTSEAPAGAVQPAVPSESAPPVPPLKPQPGTAEPKPASSPYQKPATVQQSATGGVAQSASAGVRGGFDVTNPAALQRFWRSVSSALRKDAPARGVLFMNAKVLPAPDGGGIVIEFAADDVYTYGVAQKPEVRQLLAQTMQAVAGTPVPFTLTMAEKASPAPAPEPSPVPQASPQTTESEPLTAQAPQSEWSGMVPQPEPASTMPQEPSARFDSRDSYDRVPLDVYESQEYGTPTSKQVASDSIPATLGLERQPQSQRSNNAPAMVMTQPSPQEFQSEEEAIESILTASFGQGIKFQKLTD